MINSLRGDNSVNPFNTRRERNLSSRSGLFVTVFHVLGDINDCWNRTVSRIRDVNLLSVSQCSFFNVLLYKLVPTSCLSKKLPDLEKESLSNKLPEVESKEHGNRAKKKIKKSSKIEKESCKKVKSGVVSNRVEEFLFVCIQGLINHQKYAVESVHPVCTILVTISRSALSVSI